MAHHHAHDHAHGHAHSHHGHSHAPRNFGTAFAVSVWLNTALVLLQVVYGVLAHSVALLADAGHNFGDVLSLVIAWGAHAMAARAPTKRFTYGLRSASILAALTNAVILLVATGAIAWEAIQRFFEPGEVAGVTVMVVAALGFIINGASAWLFVAGNKSDLNIRGAFLHLVGDAAVSAGVVFAGGAILLTGWQWIDPAASLIICVVIVWTTWGLLRDSLTLSLNAVPANIDADAVRAYLLAQPGVTSVHDLHIWPISTTETALTCHLVMPNGHPGDTFLDRLGHDLEEKFAIVHPTVQIEMDDAACKLAPDHVI